MGGEADLGERKPRAFRPEAYTILLYEVWVGFYTISVSFITSYFRFIYEPSNVLFSINFNAFIFFKSSNVCNDSPSINVDVSLPPISAGATTIDNLSINFSRNRIEFSVPQETLLYPQALSPQGISAMSGKAGG